MPLGKFKNFAACMNANRDKRDPAAFCGAIEAKIKERRKRKRKK